MFVRVAERPSIEPQVPGFVAPYAGDSLSAIFDCVHDVAEGPLAHAMNNSGHADGHLTYCESAWARVQVTVRALSLWFLFIVLIFICVGSILELWVGGGGGIVLANGS